MAITEEQYKDAIKQQENANETISTYHKEAQERFEQRLKDNPVFTDDELRYSAFNLCPCGHGLAYPKDCTPGYYWDCSAILKGIADKNVEHTGQLSFAFHSIKSEGQPSARGTTTRGVFRPRDTAQSEG